MHANRTTLRLSNLDDEPLPTGSTRTASLRSSSCSRYQNEKSNSIPSSRPANATTLDKTLPSVLHSSSTGHMNLQMKQVPLEILKPDPSNIHPALRNASTIAPSSGRIRPRSTSCCVPQRNRMPAARVSRWAGLTRTVSDWDGLRRDSELWFEDGDCQVHLYARGQSQRGPSFCVPFTALRESKCGSMFSLCFAQMTAPSSVISNPTRHSSICGAPTSTTNIVQLYVPAPEDASREASFNWHITTRNFFAFVFGKPLVGKNMGQAMVDLQERMRLFRSGRVNNHRDFLDYAEDQGYRDVVECTDYALAMLYYAEHYKLRDVWIDAFAHCVGMNDTLSLSPEFEPISRLTKALITRSYLDMDIQLDRVIVAVSNFLEDDLSPAFLGLTSGGRIHLDRFRSFLHGFYVEKFGYWPPPKGASFSKALYKSMYFDFKNLYDYLVDRDSTADIRFQGPASGGICVLQNVETFDKRNRFVALPHPLPLLPQHVPLAKKTPSQKTLRTFTIGSKQAKSDKYMTTRAALTAATNSRELSVTSSPLVRSYMRFERQCAVQRDEKVSMADARKVRWLLIYGTLQYLISAIRAPKEVRDAETPTYPLCCLVTEKSPWQIGARALTAPPVACVNVPDAINSYLFEPGYDLYDNTPKALTIQPDCQTSGDYFTHTNQDASPLTSRPVSVEIPAPLKLFSPTRTASVRSFRRLSFGSLGSRRNSITQKTASHSHHHEILVQGYGNGPNETTVDPPSSTISRTGSIIISNRSSKSVLPEGAGPGTSWLRPSTPDSAAHSRQSSNLRLHCDSVAKPADSFKIHPTASPNTYTELLKAPDSYSSATSLDSPFWSDKASTSSKSSASGEIYDWKERRIEDSGLLGGFVQVHDSITPSPRMSPLSSGTATPSTPNTHGEFRFTFDNEGPDLQLSSSPAAINKFNSTMDIGVAVSAPSPFAPGSHLEPLQFLEMKSIESASRSSSSKNEGLMGTLSALSLVPSEGGDDDVTRRARSDSTPSIMDAIPPSIMKAYAKKAQKLIEVEERGRKKEHRKSFWRR